jgi:hypothetical protein
VAHPPFESAPHWARRKTRDLGSKLFGTTIVGAVVTALQRFTIPVEDWWLPWQLLVAVGVFLVGSGIGVLLIFVWQLFRAPYAQRYEARAELGRLKRERVAERAIDLEPEIIGAEEWSALPPEHPNEKTFFVPFVIWNHGAEDRFTADLVSQMVGPQDAIETVYPTSDLALKWQRPNESPEERIPQHAGKRIDFAIVLPNARLFFFLRPGPGDQKWAGMRFKTADYLTGDIIIRAVGRPAWVRYHFRLSVGLVHPAGLTLDQVGSSVSIEDA